MKLLIFILTTFCIPSLFAATLSLSEGKATFNAIGRPRAIKINGEGGKVSGDLKWEKNQISGTFTCDLTEFKTGIDLRDTHMKEKYLETAKFKNAVFKLNPLSVPEDFISKKVTETELDFKGSLELHGKAKDISGKVKLKSEGSSANFNSEFEVLISDYSIGVPNWMGVTMAETVKVQVTGIITLTETKK